MGKESWEKRRMASIKIKRLKKKKKKKVTFFVRVRLISPVLSLVPVMFLLSPPLEAPHCALLPLPPCLPIQCPLLSCSPFLPFPFGSSTRRRKMVIIHAATGPSHPTAACQAELKPKITPCKDLAK